MKDQNGSPAYPEFLRSYLARIKAKIPPNWLEAPTRKGGGWRWADPIHPNTQVRIDPGREQVSMLSQKIDHVVINFHGRIIGRDGQPILTSIRADFENAHIPLEEWLQWDSWYTPKGNKDG